MTVEKITYLPTEDEPEPSSFYDVVHADADSLRRPWFHHHDAVDEEES